VTAAIVAAILEGFRPALKMAPSAWAEQNMVLPQSSNSRPGKLALTRYQKGLVDAVAEPGVKVAVFMLASQSGKSISLDCILANGIANDPGPILHVSPTEGKAFGFVRDRLDPLIAASPALRSLVGSGAKGVDSKSAKTFPGGSLNVASSYKPDDLAARSIKLLIEDEIDRFAVSAGIEGDPVMIAMKRLTTYRDGVACLASTPTFKGTSRINAWFDRGDQRRFHVSCRDCGVLAPLHKERLDFTPGEPETARLKCLDCGHKATEAERLIMVRAGEWIPTNDNGEPGVVSFHANELISEFSSLETIARAVDAAKSIHEKRVLTNTVWAEAYEATAEVELNPSELEARAEPIHGKPCPNAIDHVVAGVDIQGNRIELTFLGVNKKTKEKWVLDHVILPGNTSAEEVWRQLDDCLGRKFALEDGRVLPLAMAGVDSGNGRDTASVAAFVARQLAKGRLCYGVKGVGGDDKPMITPGSKMKGFMHRVLLIGVDNAKLAVQKELALPVPGPNTIHLPDHLQSDYFEQLAAEEQRVSYLRGFPRYKWHKKDEHARNEAFDCLVYASAIAMRVKNSPAALNAPKSPAASLESKISVIHRITSGNAAGQQ